VKQAVNAKLVKLGNTGVGVARIEATSKQGGQFVYFKPRDLIGYSGETWTELALKGWLPGRALTIDLDVNRSGKIQQVSGVRIAGQ